MPSEIELTEARNLALQKIGRNVVNFQKMEAMLKYLLKFGNYSVPVSKIQEHLAAADKRDQLKTMGHLVDLAAKALFGETPTSPTDVKEVWVTQSFCIGDGSELHVWRKELRRVVKERNTLIHHTLATWNPHSLESCQSLCGVLDAQRERIMSAYLHLESVVKAVRETHRELERNLGNVLVE